ncbi:MAG: hypothetical protein H6701_08590 [Myxococcales bacterium]|nr:hypothetical protein [Myxococcales bacterium]
MRWATAVLAGVLVLPAAAQEPAAPDEGAASKARMFGSDATDVIDAIDALHATDTVDREAEMFGGATDATDATDATATAPADTRLEAGLAPAPDDRSIEAMLDEAYDPLTLGARFTLRFQAADYGDAYADAADDATTPAELSAPMLVDLYLDGRPTDRVRAFVGARVEQDFITAGDFFDLPLVRLDEAWLKFDLERRVYLTVGKQRIKWGAARFWNPTDFLNRERLDPLSVVDLRLGVPLVKVHVPVEAAGLNVYGVALLAGADELGDVGGAGRVEWAVGPSELSATIAGRRDAPLRIGADVSAGVGPFEVRVEGAAVRDVDRARWQGTWDPDTGVAPTRVAGDDWAPQAVASVEWGVPYGDDDTLYVTGEYFYNGEGYDDGALVTWLAGTGELQPLYVARHYAGLNVAVPAPGRLDDHTFLLSGLVSLSDRSAFVRLDHQVTVLTRLRVSTYIGGGVGQDGEFTLAGDAPAFGLGEDPLSSPPAGTSVVAAPRLTAGVWLAVDI